MHARLTIHAKNNPPTVCRLSPDAIASLGRHRNNTVILPDRHASRRHAEIAFEGGAWILRDCGTLNGTRRNGVRILRPVPLSHQDEIRIGDTNLFFLLDNDPQSHTPTPADGIPVPAFMGQGESSGQTIFLADDLTALCGFMQSVVQENLPGQLVSRALRTLIQQTGAMSAGYLDFEEEDPLPKITYPEIAKVDLHLSRELTRRLQQTRQSVWLGNEGCATPESVCYVSDALCLPLHGSGDSLSGAVHVYKSSGPFTDREVRFCEAVVAYLDKSLQALRTRRQLAAENSWLRTNSTHGVSGLIGKSAVLQSLQTRVVRVAPSLANVLIWGESGVGKELVALALHKHSGRKDGPFVPVNCGAITQSLLEAELFGATKGAYSGADEDRPGLFAQAEEGTLFLDEIGEMSPECQVKLLRVLETKEFRPVGGRETFKANVRVIAATNRNLEVEVRRARFREDLFYRLQIRIEVPPLRDHPEDIPEIAEFFLEKLRRDYHRPVRLSSEAMDRLVRYPWPGNVRQLRSILEAAVAMGESEVIQMADLRLDPPKSTPGELSTLELVALEAQAIRQALRHARGVKVQAAKILGIHRETLQDKMRKYDIQEGE